MMMMKKGVQRRARDEQAGPDAGSESTLLRGVHRVHMLMMRKGVQRRARDEQAGPDAGS